MKRLRLLHVMIPALLLIGPVQSAEAAPGPNETIALVRKDCGSPVPSNCYTALTPALSWAFAQSTSAKKILVDLGPGSWAEDYTCSNDGHVTLRGAGRDSTLLLGGGSDGHVVFVDNCEKVEFVDLTIKGPNMGVHWVDGGSSTWTDVDIISTGTGTQLVGAWVDDYCRPVTLAPATHYFFGSRITTTFTNTSTFAVTAFWAGCSDNWFFGGEITMNSQNAWFSAEDATLLVSRNSTFRAYGSLIKAHAGGATIRGDLVAIMVTDDAIPSPGGLLFADHPGEFHMHGGVVNVMIDSTTAPPNPNAYAAATGIATYGHGTTAHTLETAFILQTPSVIPTWRVYEGEQSHAQAPMLWQAGTMPPMASGENNKIISEDGQDLFVETDCNFDGDCTGGTEAHLMVYNDALCTDPANPWLDTVTGRCRNDIATPILDLEDRAAALEAAHDALEARMSAAEAAISGHESRIGTLESFH